MIKIGDKVKVIRRTTHEEGRNTTCEWEPHNMDKNIGKIFKVHKFHKEYPQFLQLEDGRSKDDINFGFWYHINCLHIEDEIKLPKKQVIISGQIFNLPDAIIKNL